MHSPRQIVLGEHVTGQAVEVKFTDRNEVGYLLAWDEAGIKLATPAGEVERPAADIVSVLA